MSGRGVIIIEEVELKPDLLDEEEEDFVIIDVEVDEDGRVKETKKNLVENQEQKHYGLVDQVVLLGGINKSVDNQEEEEEEPIDEHSANLKNLNPPNMIKEEMKECNWRFRRKLHSQDKRKDLEKLIIESNQKNRRRRPVGRIPKAEKKQRKMDQNRSAALHYRNKLRLEEEMKLEHEQRLVEEQQALLKQKEDLAKEVLIIKQLLREVFSKRSNSLKQEPPFTDDDASEG